MNGLRLKSFTFSVRGELVEPQKNTFAIGSVFNNWNLVLLGFLWVLFPEVVNFGSLPSIQLVIDRTLKSNSAF